MDSAESAGSIRPDRHGTVAEYLRSLKESERFGHLVVHHETLAARPARYAEPLEPWPPLLAAALAETGVGRLYRHQAQAIDHVRAGDSIIVATPTASGKSLIYNLPVFEKLLLDPRARALYLFPLKALAQDQLRAINELAAGLPERERPPAALYDGDTSAYFRRKLRDRPPRILISNPDILHLSLLGYHDRWASFLAGLTHVVLDEVHIYRGIFGSHMAWVLRRLRRLCRFYGTDPVFILSSATVANPEELGRNLLDRPVTAVTETGAPRAGRHFLFLNPLASAAGAACQLLEAAVRRGLRTIVYTQSRKMTELISVWTGNRLGELADKLSSYRAGYLPGERREIEAGLASGDLLGVIATSALELGIDIGDLDICILVGYPGTVMTTWQRGGRVGRKQRESLIILVAQEDALDQYFMRRPDDFFSREVEPTILNPVNRPVMRRHLICAAAEAPVAAGDPLIACEDARREVAVLAEAGELLLAADGRHWFGTRRYPHRQVNLRGGGRTFVIRNVRDETVLGEIDYLRSFKECHPGAIYLHRGGTWKVRELDIENREVVAEACRVTYFTRPLSSKHTEILETHAVSEGRGFRVCRGRLRVTDRVTGLQRRLVKGHQLVATEQLDLPPVVFETEGLWLEIPAAVQAAIEQDRLHFMGGIHALEHAAISVFPLLVLCDRNDIGGIAHPWHEQLPGAAVFIYDGHPGGVGLSRKAFEEIDELLRLTYRVVADCPCELGCPSCIHSPKCGSGNRPMDKEAARRLLEVLSGGTGKTVKRIVVSEPRSEAEVQSTPVAGRPPRFGVFDVETQRSAAEVGGWHRAERMRVSAAVLYDSVEDSFETYPEPEIPALIERLRQFELVVGFNNKRFDNQVLSAYAGGFRLSTLPTLDILEVIRNRLGYRLSLDRLAEQTLGVKKSGTGLQALEWFKQGRMDLIEEYCRKDVEITRDLYLFGLRHNYLLFADKAGNVVRLPVRFDRHPES